MKTAITMNPDASPNDLLKVVQLAEGLGFSICYIADQGFSRDVYITLSMLACGTKKIQLGPGITHPYTRHPVVTALSIASLDELSGGRAFLGLGAGGSRRLVPMQIERKNPLQACHETAEICRQLWSGQAVSYKGDLFSLESAKINFTCRPDIELHWAARGPKMLALGGEIADVSLLHGIPRFDLDNVVAHIREGAKRGGRELRLQYSIPLVYDDVSRESARMRTVYRLVDSSEEVKNRLGLTSQIIEEMCRKVTMEGIRAAAPLVSDEVLSHYILEGTVTDCASTLRHIINTYPLDGLTFEVPDATQAEELLSRAADILAHI